MMLFNRMNMSQKLTILTVFLLLIAAVPTTLYINTVIVELDITKHEVAGTEPIIALQKTVQYVQQHRGVSAGLLNGNESLASRLSEIQRELNNAVDIVDAKLKEAKISAKNMSLWSVQKQRIIEIEQAVLARQLKTPESTAQHTKLITDLLFFNEELLDESNLVIDPVKGTYYLMTATMINAPKLAENMGQIRALGSAILAAGSLTDEGRARLLGILGV